MNSAPDTNPISRKQLVLLHTPDDDLCSQWERTFDSIPDLVAILDNRHRIVRMNRAMAERLGTEPGCCIGKLCFECVHGAIGPVESCPHARTMADGKEHILEVHEERLGGDFLVSTTPLTSKAGEVVGSVHVARDITTQKQTENALRSAQEQLAKANAALEVGVRERTAKLQEMVEELETFSYSMAHDMRAPLRSMEGMAALLLEDYGPLLDQQGRDYLGRIKAAANRQDRLIRDVLQFSQVIHREFELKPVDLNELLLEVIREYPNLSEHREQISVEQPLRSVLGHEASLAQCVSNLLENALKFIAPGRRPQVRVWSNEQGGKVRLWVEDNGIGIDPAKHGEIFRLFVRLHNAEAYDGTGIGLAVVKKAVCRMGGQVGVESNVGAGSRFWMELQAT